MKLTTGILGTIAALMFSGLVAVTTGFTQVCYIACAGLWAFTAGVNFYLAGKEDQ